MIKHTDVQYRVTGMRGRPKDSGPYSTRELGVDAPKLALAAWHARGGRIEMRTITITDWYPYRPEQDHGTTQVNIETPDSEAPERAT